MVIILLDIVKVIHNKRTSFTLEFKGPYTNIPFLVRNISTNIESIILQLDTWVKLGYKIEISENVKPLVNIEYLKLKYT